jgi:hypothetical protein
MKCGALMAADYRIYYPAFNPQNIGSLTQGGSYLMDKMSDNS